MGVLSPAEGKRRVWDDSRSEGAALGRTWVRLEWIPSGPSRPPRGQFCGRASW